MLAAGKMDRLVVVQARSVTRSASGEEVETWATIASVWAHVLPMTGREFYSAAGNQVAPAETARFRIRYRSDITPLHRLQHDGKTWNILNRAEMGRREGLEITAEAVAQ